MIAFVFSFVAPFLICHCKIHFDPSYTYQEATYGQNTFKKWATGNSLALLTLEWKPEWLLWSERWAAGGSEASPLLGDGKATLMLYFKKLFGGRVFLILSGLLSHKNSSRSHRRFQLGYLGRGAARSDRVCMLEAALLEPKRSKNISTKLVALEFPLPHCIFFLKKRKKGWLAMVLKCRFGTEQQVPKDVGDPTDADIRWKHWNILFFNIAASMCIFSAGSLRRGSPWSPLPLLAWWRRNKVQPGQSLLKSHFFGSGHGAHQEYTQKRWKNPKSLATWNQLLGTQTRDFERFLGALLGNKKFESLKSITQYYWWVSLLVSDPLTLWKGSGMLAFGDEAWLHLLIGQPSVFTLHCYGICYGVHFPYLGLLQREKLGKENLKNYKHIPSNSKDSGLKSEKNHSCRILKN